MKKANISSSKIYLILEKLMQKGLVSSIQIEGVHHFQCTNPNTILDYIESKKEELEKTKTEMKQLIPEILAIKKSEIEETAQIYKGLKGIRASYLNILNELKEGEEYCIFAMSGKDIIDSKLQVFFKNFHNKRIENKIKLKIIVNSDSANEYQKNNLPVGNYELRKHPFSLPISMAISKHRITSMFFNPETIAYEIVSDIMTKNYQEHFDKLWKEAKFVTKKA